MKSYVAVPILMLLASSGCSSTPGDAAAAGGKSSQAAELYRRGAQQGDAEAAFKLARLLESGGVRNSQYGTSGDWYIKACDLGYVVGCHNAGVALEYGTLGLRKDLEESRRKYEQAASRGYMQSQYNLGSMFANRYFADDVEGLAWLLAAQTRARACLPDALCKWVLDDPPHHVAALESRMTPGDIDRAESRAQALAAGH